MLPPVQNYNRYILASWFWFQNTCRLGFQGVIFPKNAAISHSLAMALKRRVHNPREQPCKYIK
uniref:Uncharacterized protein n=1 Tax=Arundo donax TaxID=35708 RepID=A0A0A9GRP8_ARUDO